MSCTSESACPRASSRIESGSVPLRPIVSARLDQAVSAEAQASFKGQCQAIMVEWENTFELLHGLRVTKSLKA